MGSSGHPGLRVLFAVELSFGGAALITTGARRQCRTGKPSNTSWSICVRVDRALARLLRYYERDSSLDQLFHWAGPDLCASKADGAHQNDEGTHGCHVSQQDSPRLGINGRLVYQHPHAMVNRGNNIEVTAMRRGRTA